MKPSCPGYLLISFSYLTSFWIIAAISLTSVPVFLWQVRMERGCAADRNLILPKVCLLCSHAFL